MPDTARLYTPAEAGAVSGLKLKAVLKWGPMGTQQLSEAKSGKFQLIGYAGNSAPDHVDQLQSLPEYFKWLK